MLTASPTLGLGIKKIGLTAISAVAILFFSTNISVATAQLTMTGQQFLPNGTGLAYFSDGSISKFEHEMTPQEGWYYDNTTTIFYTGEIPGISSANNTTCSGGELGRSDSNQNSTTTSI